MSGEKQRPIICWDSCVFIAWFNQEKEKAEYMERMRFVLEDIIKNRVTLLVSAVSVAEVLNHKKNRRAGDDFRKFVHRKNVIRASVDFRVAELAASIRERTIDGPTAKVGTPDAMVAATAIFHQAKELHTFDDKLLNAGGTAYLDHLVTSKPRNLARHGDLYGKACPTDKPLSLHGIDPDERFARRSTPRSPGA